MPTPAEIAAALDTVPAWAKLALCAPREGLREDARAEIALCLHSALYGAPTPDPRQIALPLA